MNHFDHYVWITPTRDTASPIITRNFAYDGGSAVIDVTGLGYYELRINGVKVGDTRLVPLVTDYFRRDFSQITYPCHDIFTHRIFYHTYDITDFLHSGENRIEIQLGGGYFVQNERIAEGRMGYADRPVCHYRITFTKDEGSQSVIGSDGSELWYPSEIIYSNLFIGETIDPSAEKTGKAEKVGIFEMPETELTKEIGTPDRLIRTITPEFCGIAGARLIYDAKENISGVVRIKSALPNGIKIRLTFAENRAGDGTLDYETTGSHYIGVSGRHQIMTDVFVSDGSEKFFEPKFVWHGFRYFDIAFEGTEMTAEELLPMIVPEVLVIHADNGVTSAFDSDSEGLNFLYSAYIRTQLDNMHGGFPMDCPHRERLGYTGDGQCCAQAGMQLLDSREFYRKWIRDIFDCQNTENGHIQHTAPFQGGGGGPGGWGSAVITVPYSYWKQYGDTDLLREYYPAMVKWFSYLRDHMENGLVVREEDGGWCLGDWCMLDSGMLPESYV
ncbi:MAG: family 78 glycoside hydrolase catalytic domain, partial [Clostridia bacterium]|nr:family 78 glycoside hydrolase catalytic domain [Clostridia bacterium]